MRASRRLLLCALCLAAGAAGHAQVRLTTASASAAADTVTALVDAGSGAGTLVLYGSPCPATADAAPSGTVLAELTFNDPAFAPANDGVAALAGGLAIVDSAANASGTAQCFRALASNGTVVMQGDVSDASGTGVLKLRTPTIVAGQPVALRTFGYTHPLSDDVITATSCSAAHVQAAVDAASTGQTVRVPAGACTWTTAVTVEKAISLIGAGVGSTVLTGSGALSSGFFYVTNVTSSQLLRISGFRFVMSNRTQAYGIRIENSVDLSALRIDHNRFDEGNAQILCTGSKGVIDHNEFYNGDKGVSFGAGSAAQATASWASMAAGTADALFIEDNVFIDDANYPSAYNNEKIGTFNGGKLVIRHNEFDFDDFPLAVTSYPFMAHGSAAGGVALGYWQIGTGARRGQSVIEFYENTIHGPRIDFLYVSRGSANLVWNNAITNAVTNAPRVYFYEEEQYEAQWSPSRTAWPAEDQVHNSFIWGNTYNGAAYFDQSAHIAIGASSTSYIQEDREFFLHAPAASGGKASFTGLNGGTNTYPTDGSTYPTLGTMTFSGSGANEYYGYVPYTYPHPLAQ